MSRSFMANDDDEDSDNDGRTEKERDTILDFELKPVVQLHQTQRQQPKPAQQLGSKGGTTVVEEFKAEVLNPMEI